MAVRREFAKPRQCQQNAVVFAFITFTLLAPEVNASRSSVGDAPYDTKVVGDYTGLSRRLNKFRMADCEKQPALSSPSARVITHPVKEDVKKKTLLPSPLREAVWLASSPASVLLLLRGVLGFVRALDRRVVQRRCQPQWLIPT